MNSRRLTGGVVALSVSLLLAACGGSEPETSAPPSTSPATTAAPSTTVAPTTTVEETTTTTTTIPITPESVLESTMASRGMTFTTGVVNDSCGQMAVVSDEFVTELWAWDGAQWTAAQGSRGALADAPARAISGATLVDLSGDGNGEWVISWELDPAFDNRPWGVVLWGQEQGCDWETVWMVDSCGGEKYFAGLNYNRFDGLTGSGFPSACSGRTTIAFEWVNGADAFVGRPVSASEVICPEYEFNLDLALQLCDESWAVEMMQYYLAERGYAIRPDGYFGAGTQEAVMHFQQSNGLVPDGLVGPITWSTMFPPSWDYPDYDGDGVSTPREMAHF